LEHSGVARHPQKQAPRVTSAHTTLWIRYEQVYRNVVTHCDPPETLRVVRPRVLYRLADRREDFEQIGHSLGGESGVDSTGFAVYQANGVIRLAGDCAEARASTPLVSIRLAAKRFTSNRVGVSDSWSIRVLLHRSSGLIDQVAHQMHDCIANGQMLNVDGDRSGSPSLAILAYVACRGRTRVHRRSPEISKAPMLSFHGGVFP
jgi:hypothetical protein